jgi:hypothetical protein
MLARWPKPGLRLRAAAGAAVTAHCCWCCSTQSRSARTCHGPLHVMSAAVLVYVSVGHARAECVLLLRRLHRRVACYWAAAGRCRAVGSPRSAGGTWLAAHFAGANNSNHPHSAAPFGKGPTIWEGAPGRFGEGLGRMRANVTSGCRRALQRAAAGGSRRQQGGRGALAIAVATAIAVAVAVAGAGAVAATVDDGSGPGLAGQGVEQPPPHSPLWPTRPSRSSRRWSLAGTDRLRAPRDAVGPDAQTGRQDTGEGQQRQGQQGQQGQ